ncbi:MAG: rhomboid family intramembrane serine protease [Cellulophaga sp.]|nr:rhomboid family intramembrane serine protease [Cellulophaga sp.]
MMRLTDTVKHLIIINVLFFIATQLVGDQMYQWFALWFPANENFQIWQVITHMFMHGGWSHILFNMFGLYMFGTAVEQYLGRNQFLFLYFSAGLGAAAFQLGYYYFEYIPIHTELINLGLTSDQIVEMITNNRAIEGLTEVQFSAIKDAFPMYRQTYFASMVGASGCIMGVLAAFGVMNPNAELMLIFLPIPIKAKYFIPGIILLDVISAFSGQSFFSPSNTAYMAHVGGALIGFIMMWYWKKNSFNKNRWD